MAAKSVEDQQSPAVASPHPELSETAEDTRPRCPHCDNLLKSHEDLIGSLHCFGSHCIGCCFTLIEGLPVLRDHFPKCPADKT